MPTTSQLSRTCHQPRGGYLNPSKFEVNYLNDGNQLHEQENVHPIIIGLAVEYLTKLMIGIPGEKAFDISIRGARKAYKSGVENALEKADQMLSHITGLDDISIINACTLVTYDSWYRDPTSAKDTVPTLPDPDTITNIRIMVNRSIHFFEIYGPVTRIDFQFGPTEDPDDEKTDAKRDALFAGKPYGGYTIQASTGEGDFLTKDTMWDFKVLKDKINSKHTLQILLYWIMGQHSGQDIYKNVTKVGVFNPRLNSICIMDISNVPHETIITIEKEILKY